MHGCYCLSVGARAEDPAHGAPAGPAHLRGPGLLQVSPDGQGDGVPHQSAVRFMLV